MDSITNWGNEAEENTLAAGIPLAHLSLFFATIFILKVVNGHTLFESFIQKSRVARLFIHWKKYL